MRHEEFIDAVADRASVTHDRAEILVRATLRTLAERISAGEARDLGAQLPTALRDPLFGSPEPAEPFGREEFVRRVSERAGVDAGPAREGARAVLTTVRQAVSGDEFDDVMSQLSKELRDLVESTTWRGGVWPVRG